MDESSGSVSDAELNGSVSGSVLFPSAPDFITCNPFRVLGVYSNSSARDREANKSKINAFARVSKSIEFTPDFSRLFGTVNRSGDAVSSAVSALAAPSGLIEAGQFWFMNASHPDKIAFKNLADGNISASKEIWMKVADMSACQNMIILELSSGNFKAAAEWADRLYGSYPEDFVEKISGNLVKLSGRDLISSFIDRCIPRDSIISSVSQLPPAWKDIAALKIAPEITARIKDQISKLSTRSGNWMDCRAALDDFFKAFMPLLSELCHLYPNESLKITSVTDPAADAVRHACIAWYNGTDKPRDAVAIIEYAKRIRDIPASSSSKRKTEENISQLDEKIRSLPPVEIESDYSAFIEILKGYDSDYKDDSRIVKLVNDAYPYLSRIKKHCGTDSFYSGASDQIAIRVMNYVGSVYAERIVDEIRLFGLYSPHDRGFESQRRKLLSTVRSAEGIFSSMYGKTDVSSELADDFCNLKSVFDRIADMAGISYHHGVPSLAIGKSASRPSLEPAGTSSSASSSDDEANSAHGCGCLIFIVIVVIICIFSR
jgi:hypothetical protein